MRVSSVTILLLIISIEQIIAQNVSDMLEKALTSVVTVAVYQSEDYPKLLGHRRTRGTRSEPEAVSNTAYEKVLDMSGAKRTGSGFIIEKNGKKYVITNAHVVDIASSLNGSICSFSFNRTKYRMKNIGGDSFYDIAVLEFIDEPKSEITAMEFRLDEVRIGEPVYAIGNPLGIYPYTITEGIIGGKNRILEHGATGRYGYLQSTATISWGNSGGPLIDSRGRVVGINSQIEKQSIGFQPYVFPQLNFALEAPLAQKLVDEIISNNGMIKRAYLGIEISQSYTTLLFGGAELLDSVPVITKVFPGSPAYEYLKENIGYSIRSINGVEVKYLQEILGEFEKIKPGEKTELVVQKSGQSKTVQLQTQELNEEQLEKLVSSVFKGKLGTLKKDEEGITYIGEYDEYSKRKVLAAGIADLCSVWSVNTLSDLGFILRLAGMYGYIELYLLEESYSGDDVSKKALYISGDGSIIKQTLWY